MSEEVQKYCPFTSQPCWEDECELWDEDETVCVFHSIFVTLLYIERALKPPEDKK
jgi:hypothetical protein